MGQKKNINWFLQLPFKLWAFNVKPRFDRLLVQNELINYRKESVLSPEQKQFAESLEIFKPVFKGHEQSGVLLVQVVKDYEFTARFAAAAKVLAEKNNLQINFYDPDWTAGIGWKKRRSKLSRLLFKTRPEKIYAGFGNDVVFHLEDKFSDQEFIFRLLNEIKNKIKIPEDILELKFEDVLVGDLIYDTYLRYFHQPTIETINTDLIRVIEIALNIFYNFSEFLKKGNVKALINIYSTYLDHGVTARICLKKGIKVYTVGSYSYIIQEATVDFPYHQINHTLFDPGKTLSDEQLESARQKLNFRFSGKNDGATSYMRRSAFANTPVSPELREKFSERSRNIVIYPHEFYDSPHINRKLQFADLYQFLKQTLYALRDLSGTTVFIKTHPNSIPGTKEKILELVSSFNRGHFQVLDELVSNHHIIELKPDLIATARGTVCIEMACFEIPTVALYDNLYTNFTFVHTCKEKESYFAILRGEKKPAVSFNKKEIESFYYQAFIEKAATGDGNIIDLLAARKGDTYNDAYLKFIMENGYLGKREELLALSEKALSGEQPSPVVHSQKMAL